MSYCLTASISHMPFQLYDYATFSQQLLLRPHTMQDPSAVMQGLPHVQAARELSALHHCRLSTMFGLH